MNLSQILSSFQNKKIAIIGDVMLDTYTIGKVTRVSPEAPVPVVLLEQEDKRVGGAGNVALNITALGAKAFICSVIGDDIAGKDLTKLLKESNIDVSALVVDENHKTTIKTRVIANNQQLLRIDNECTNCISDAQQKTLIEKTKELIDSGIDALIFEDYNKGVLTPFVIKEITNHALSHGVSITVDPKKEQFLDYKNVQLFKPNLKEVIEGLNLSIDPINDVNSLVVASQALRHKLNHEITFITLSENGVFIDDGKEWFIIPAHRRNIADVSGAGDTVIAVATLCFASGLSIKEIAEIANIAGGLVCEHSGVVSIDKNHLEKEAIKSLNFQG